MVKIEIGKILLVAATLTLFDSIYLYFMKDYFDKQISLVQGSGIKMNVYAAILCYVALVFGLYYFIIKDGRNIYEEFLLGIIIYSVYDLTSLALLKNWSVTTAVIDTLWGGILFTLTTFAVYKLLAMSRKT